MFELDSRQILIYLAIKYGGDYMRILAALQMHEDINVSHEEVKNAVDSLNCKAITFLDYDYPEKLKRMYRPPLVLFYYGDITLLSDKKTKYGVVGSREYSEYGKETTEKIVKEMGKERILVSGLAKGIDALAHQTAIDSGARTIAVLGSGIDNCYPTENQELYEVIKKRHLIISEYPNMCEPSSGHFPKRNRIIVGLSDYLIVPHINSYQSGTMISINMCLQSNKPLFVVPHPIFAPTINNEIIKEGADLALSGRQILDDLKVSWKVNFS